MSKFKEYIPLFYIISFVIIVVSVAQGGILLFCHSSHKNYFPNGKLESEYKWYGPNSRWWQQKTYSSSDGWNKTYYENGQLREEVHYTNGKFNGPWNKFYDNGQIMESSIYVMDLKEGRNEEYLPDGKLKAIYIYKNGNIITSKRWYEGIGWIGDRIK